MINDEDDSPTSCRSTGVWYDNIVGVGELM